MKSISVRMRPWLALPFIGVSLCTGQSAQQSAPDKPTRIGNHEIGESFGTWLAVNADVSPAEIPAAAAVAGLRLGEACKKYVHGPQWKHEAQQVRSDCKALLPIRDTGRGEFQTLVGGQPITWMFIGGLVAEARIEQALPNTSLEVAHLTEAYGPATKTKTSEYQNAYGAKWECLDASWNMPDGSLIRLAESINNLASGPTRWLTITFYSKERINSLAGGNDKPNPFLSPTAKP